MSGSLDRVTGRLKNAAGELADDALLRRDGVNDERKADAKDELGEAQREADRHAEEVGRLERDSARSRSSQQAPAHSTTPHNPTTPQPHGPRPTAMAADPD